MGRNVIVLPPPAAREAGPYLRAAAAIATFAGLVVVIVGLLHPFVIILGYYPIAILVVLTWVLAPPVIVARELRLYRTAWRLIAVIGVVSCLSLLLFGFHTELPSW
jgi:hypothetical protein